MMFPSFFRRLAQAGSWLYAFGLAGGLDREPITSVRSLRLTGCLFIARPTCTFDQILGPLHFIFFKACASVSFPTSPSRRLLPGVCASSVPLIPRPRLLTESTIWSHAFFSGVLPFFLLPPPPCTSNLLPTAILQLTWQRPHGSLPRQHYAHFTAKLVASGFDVTTNLIFMNAVDTHFHPPTSGFLMMESLPSLNLLMTCSPRSTSAPALPWDCPTLPLKICPKLL